jgi:hypothetical protein
LTFEVPRGAERAARLPSAFLLARVDACDGKH